MADFTPAAAPQKQILAPDDFFGQPMVRPGPTGRNAVPEQPQPSPGQTDQGGVSYYTQIQPNQPWWYPLANGAMLGQGDRIRAATSATKEALSGGLPYTEAYNQALAQYQAASGAQRERSPVATTVGEIAGSIPPTMMGGTLAGAGIKGLGAAQPYLAPVTRFLTGEAGTARAMQGARNALGQFVPWKPMAGPQGVGLRALSQAANMAREGAQAGALTSGLGGDTTGEQAWRGLEYGGIGGGLVGPTTEALSRVPLPPFGRGLGTLGTAGLAALGARYVDPIMEQIAAHPALSTGAGGLAGSVLLSRALAEHPAAREQLARAGVSAATTARGELDRPGGLKGQ